MARACAIAFSTSFANAELKFRKVAFPSSWQSGQIPAQSKKYSRRSGEMTVPPRGRSLRSCSALCRYVIHQCGTQRLRGGNEMKKKWNCVRQDEGVLGVGGYEDDRELNHMIWGSVVTLRTQSRRNSTRGLYFPPLIPSNAPSSTKNSPSQ